MKIHRNYKSWSLAGATVLLLAVLLVAWKDNPQQPGTLNSPVQDTVPKKERSKVTRLPGDRDLDYELRQLDNAQEQLENFDWSIVEKSVETALAAIDFEKINSQALAAVENIDFDKIGRDVEASLAKIDFGKMGQDIAEAMANLDDVDRDEIRQEMEKAQREVKEELAKADWKKELSEAKKINKEEIRKEMEKAKKEMEKAKLEMKDEKVNFKEEMKKAGKEIETAKAALKGYQEMIYDMEKEGLLDTKKDYSIEYKNGDLFINGTQQPANVTGKYKKYFKKDNVKIKKENGDIDINDGNSIRHKD